MQGEQHALLYRGGSGYFIFPVEVLIAQQAPHRNVLPQLIYINVVPPGSVVQLLGVEMILLLRCTYCWCPSTYL